MKKSKLFSLTLILLLAPLLVKADPNHRNDIDLNNVSFQIFQEQARDLYQGMTGQNVTIAVQAGHIIKSGRNATCTYITADLGSGLPTEPDPNDPALFYCDIHITKMSLNKNARIIRLDP